MIPIFKSHFSIGKSILTIEEPSEIKPFTPVSIASITNDYELKKTYICDSSFSGFISAYKNLKNTQTCFGLELIVVPNDEKTDESCDKESKIICWINNTNGYKDLIKISSFAATEGFYYIPRISWTKLKELWTENLTLTIPFYDSFIHKNLFTGAGLVPDLGSIKPNVLLTDTNLPFDPILRNAAAEYAKINSFETLEYHPIYYYQRSDFKAYMVYRCVSNRGHSYKKSTFESPELDHLSQDSFCWEAYCEKAGIEFQKPMEKKTEEKKG